MTGVSDAVFKFSSHRPLGGSLFVQISCEVKAIEFLLKNLKFFLFFEFNATKFLYPPLYGRWGLWALMQFSVCCSVAFENRSSHNDNMGTLARMGTHVVAARPMWLGPWPLRKPPQLLLCGTWNFMKFCCRG